MSQRCRHKTFSDTGKTIENCKLFEILGFIYYSAGVRNKIDLIAKMPLSSVTAKTFPPDKKTCYINQNQLAIPLVFKKRVWSKKNVALNQ
jgi:hypothetical protein